MTFEQFNDQTIQNQALAAGFATVDLYIQNLIERDAEVLAIKEGIAAMEAGDVQDFVEFARQFRAKNNIATDA
jgi:hypothetical protein